MLEWPLLLLAGLLGSSHCLGMCGGFVLAAGAGATSLANNLGRQLAYTAGRVFTYAFLGAAAGYGGSRLQEKFPGLATVPAVLAIGAGIILIWQGLLATGWGRRFLAPSHSLTCLAGNLFSHYLGRGSRSVFLAGLFTGFLPCGLLYGMLTLAASTRNLAFGAGTMIVFGAGTAPALVLLGCSGSVVSLATRRRIYLAAAWCLMLSGVISIYRGVSFMGLAGSEPHCPLCP